jgi:quercetin dioxygenase-like cupin family protein
MSHPDLIYPPPRYRGETGETTARLRSTDQEPDLRYPNGTRVHYLATHTSTDGLFGLFRWEMPGGAGGPGPHFHRTMAESFYVLAGLVSLYDGQDWRDGRPGDYLYVPEGGIHGFRNGSDEPASMLILFAPGATREPYFETLARIGEGLVMSDEEKADFYARHDNHWV